VNAAKPSAWKQKEKFILVFHMLFCRFLCRSWRQNNKVIVQGRHKKPTVTE